MKALSTTKRVELVGKKKFVAAALNLEYETYVVYVASLNSITLVMSFSSTPLDVHPSRKPQISGLIAEKALTMISNKYADFADVFSSDLAFKLPQHTGINNHAIKLVDGQQPSHRPIYSLGPIELETLKAYIETNLANGFIRLSKSPTGVLILFDRKSNSFFWLCVNYRDLNNFMTKNRYPLPLIGKLLDRLGRVWRFT